VALGASRGRLVRQTLTGAVVLTVIGGASGRLLAVWAVPVLTAWAPSDVPRLDEAGVQWSTLAFTVGVAGVVGIGCGVLAALPGHWRPAPCSTRMKRRHGSTAAVDSATSSSVPLDRDKRS
jgi:putative ABC transport system permease protein